MNILSIAVACILVYYLYQGSRPLKRQKGGNKGVVIVLVVLLLAGGGVAAYFLLKKGKCTDFKCPSGQSLKVSPSPCQGRTCKPTECCISDGPPKEKGNTSPTYREIGTGYCLDGKKNIKGIYWKGINSDIKTEDKCKDVCSKSNACLGYNFMRRIVSGNTSYCYNYGPNLKHEQNSFTYNHDDFTGKKITSSGPDGVHTICKRKE